jgi:hypothetical protein
LSHWKLAAHVILAPSFNSSYVAIVSFFTNSVSAAIHLHSAIKVVLVSFVVWQLRMVPSHQPHPKPKTAFGVGVWGLGFGVEFGVEFGVLNLGFLKTPNSGCCSLFTVQYCTVACPSRLHFTMVDFWLTVTSQRKVGLKIRREGKTRHNHSYVVFRFRVWGLEFIVL